MFDNRSTTSAFASALNILELIYHNAVRSVRATHSNAFVGLFINMSQTIILVLVFYGMFAVLGLRGSAIRGDFMLYIMSGIFLFMTHAKAMGAVAGSAGPSSPILQHLPMNTAISIASAALGALYTQVLSMLVILYVYHVGWGPVVIHDPIGAFGMVLVSWFSGVAIGMIFLALKPWFPGFTGVASQIYIRANMIASGKMFVANTLPSSMLVMFDWNPLFHTIDQARGFAFINYNPHFSSISYPMYVSIGLLTLGLMGEFYTRKNASLSWAARR